MPLSLRPGVCWCTAGGRVVLLDLQADRYLALSAAADAAFLALSAGHPDHESLRNALAPLIQGGQLIESAQSVFPPAPGLAPPKSFIMDGIGRKALPSLEAWLLQLLMARSLCTKPLYQLIGSIEQRKHGRAGLRAGRPAKDMVRSIASFLASNRLITAQEQCLRWSLSMAEYLSRRNCYPNLVIGVRMLPFAAHAWVQAGDVVLSDTVEHVAPYTPILVV